MEPLSPPYTPDGVLKVVCAADSALRLLHLAYSTLCKIERIINNHIVFIGLFYVLQSLCVSVLVQW